ncbi:MAG TPA: hypothetical protein PLF13_01810 [candidate division Zixibacteria bacterium]|nr:hypothetical protein [candidate division Zixibacteria bacterium]
MKKITILLVMLALSLTCSYALASPRVYFDNDSDHEISITSLNKCRMGEVQIEIDDEDIYLTHELYFDDEILINEKHELYVNEVKVELNADQQKLVDDYYTLIFELRDYAKEIGWEGAKIGIHGAKLGLQAIGGLFKMLFTSYDDDDFERDMELAADKIETKAERLEQKAEYLEDMADLFEEINYEMFEDIPALKELEWY